MSLPALQPTADTRSITERVNAIIRNLYNRVIPSDGSASPLDDTRVLQVVHFQTGAVATGTTTIPLDNTIPQQTEGDQYMSLAITPKSATSRLIIDVVIHFGSSAVNNMIAALFQNSTANALAVSYESTQASFPIQLRFRHVMTSGTTSATTFKVRAGGSLAGTTTFNGDGGNARFGGTLASSITITEVLP